MVMFLLVVSDGVSSSTFPSTWFASPFLPFKILKENKQKRDTYGCITEIGRLRSVEL